MPKVTLIVGLPGSGKSTYAKKHFSGILTLDDFSRNSSLEELQELVRQGKDCVVIDPLLCYPHTQNAARSALAEMGAEVAWVFFANEPDKCRANIRRRAAAGDRREVDEFINMTTKDYVIPPGITPIPVYSSEEG